MVEEINTKLSFKIQKLVHHAPEAIIEKITAYLTKSGYKIVERTETSLVFNEDVYSNRTSARSDYYTRVEDGKFEIVPSGSGIVVNLVYRVSIMRELIFLLIILIVGITVDYKALLLSALFVVNFIYKIRYLNNNIIDEILNEPG
ncbi:hypothetical protein DDR33_23255 [Pararcticibacter amylolyticus]|uniref:Uncharacterized protein n=1 Tax=Pararcticibacter amylolyticus TaxID=2173175 RepID=A0A2U2PA23_9SPHI|nr:hypothetical protein DDR33_23255 [Pararcticibacter amylolyticus]